jgi:hypothetical protein
MSIHLLKTRHESGEAVDTGKAAFKRFQNGLATALTVSKEEMDRRIAEDNAARTADRVQRGYKKRGPKPRK